MKSSPKTEITTEEVKQAYADIQKKLQESNRPAIKQGYKSAREIAKETGVKYNTARGNLRDAAEQKLVPVEVYVVNGHRTAYYLLK